MYCILFGWWQTPFSLSLSLWKKKREAPKVGNICSWNSWKETRWGGLLCSVGAHHLPTNVCHSSRWACETAEVTLTATIVQQQQKQQQQPQPQDKQAKTHAKVKPQL